MLSLCIFFLSQVSSISKPAAARAMIVRVEPERLPTAGGAHGYGYTKNIK